MFLQDLFVSMMLPLGLFAFCYGLLGIVPEKFKGIALVGMIASCIFGLFWMFGGPLYMYENRAATTTSESSYTIIEAEQSNDGDFILLVEDRNGQSAEIEVYVESLRKTSSLRDELIVREDGNKTKSYIINYSTLSPYVELFDTYELKKEVL